MRVLLNETEISQPVDWENLILRKERDARWGGIVENTSGQLEEDGLLFDDELSMSIIRSTWQKYLHRADLKLRVIEKGDEWSSSLDWDTMLEKNEGITIGLVDRAARHILTAAQLTREFTPTDTYQLEGLPLGGKITARIPAEKSLVAGQKKDHALPFKGDKDGIGEYLETEGTLPFWRNDSEYELTVRVELDIHVAVTIKEANTYSVFLRLYNTEGGVVDSQLIGTYGAGNSVWAYAREVSVSRLHGIGIYIVCSANDVYSFQYNVATSAMSLTEAPDDTTQVPCFRLDQLLELWGQVNGLQIRDYTGQLSGHYVTSGALLRGLNRNVKVNIDRMLTNLRKLLNLKIGYKDNQLIIRRAPARSDTQGYEVLDFARSPLPMYGSITYGFQNWRSETIRGYVENNGRFTFFNDFLTQPELDLSLDYLSASRFLIEKLRRNRYTSLGSEADEEHDDTLFLLGAEDYISLQIQAHASELAYNYPLQLIASEGYYPVTELAAAPPPRYEPYRGVAELRINLVEYNALGETLVLDHGGTRYVLEIDDVTYRPDSGTATVSGKILSLDILPA